MNDAALPGHAARHRRGTPIDTVVSRLADLLGPGPARCGPGGEVHDVVIAEPDEPLDAVPGDGLHGALVLAVGARGPEVAAMVSAAGAAGAAAVAVRLPAPESQERGGGG
ncbi:hypothetical protein, partial [Nocardia asteroides]